MNLRPYSAVTVVHDDFVNPFLELSSENSNKC